MNNMNNKMTAPKEIYLQKFDQILVNKILDEWGVCVVEKYFTTEQSDNWRNSIINWIHKISPATKSEWKTFNLPNGPREGMMQNIVSHCPTVWEIREHFYPIFRDLLQEEELLTSIDGATVHPPILNKNNDNDWPHIDQTIENIRCIQAQVVLTDTTASFRCTPKSHLHHRTILEICEQIDDTTNWCKPNSVQLKAIKPLFEYWQIPIHVPKGSMIFWRSNTIHSAQKNEKLDDDWRCVVYVCMRPKEEYSPKNLNTLIKSAKEGRTTNHWGTTMFPKKPGFWRSAGRCEEIEELANNPQQLVVEYNDLLKKLTAQMEY